MFHKAVKHEAKLRLAIAGPSGSGKTYTALAVGTALGKTAVVDTEHGSASKYADLFDFDVVNFDAPFHPDRFVESIEAAAAAGYEVLVIDSLSHAWNGAGGLLEIVDQIAKRMKTSNSFAAWKDATPIQNRLIDGIVSAPIHIISTMRSKQEYILEQVDRGNGRSVTVPKKVGMAPIQRDSMEYEFDVYLDMDIENNAIVQKTRCPALTGTVIARPGLDLAATLREWLHGEAPPPAPKPSAPAVSDAPMTDDELVVSETPAAKFFDAVTALINRYENVHATKAAAKKLGFTAVPGTPAARVDMYRAIKAHAAERDAEEAEAKAEPLFDLEENGAYIE